MAYIINSRDKIIRLFVFLVPAVLFYTSHRVAMTIRDRQFYSPMNALSMGESVDQQESKSDTKQPPTSIYIPKINKRHVIQAAIVKDNAWQLFDTSVAWLSTSAVPGEGNVILYAHNWKSLWGDLYKLVPGDVIELYQGDRLHVYRVIESKAVLKHDIESILSEENRLTLYTCEGAFDQKRRVVYAIPKQ